MTSNDFQYPVDLKSEAGFSTGLAMESPEQTAGFFASPNTIAAGACLLVKRYANGREDTIHILRLNKGPKGSRFKFPAMFAGTVSKRLLELLELIKQDGDTKVPGLETPTAYDELCDDAFWTGPNSIRVVMFHMKPYLTTYKKIMFRIWNAVDPVNQKVYENEGGRVVWKGPAASLTIEETMGLAHALDKLSKSFPERE